MTLRLFDIEDRPVAVLEGMSAWVWRDGRWRDAPGLARKDGVPFRFGNSWLSSATLIWLPLLREL